MGSHQSQDHEMAVFAGRCSARLHARRPVSSIASRTATRAVDIGRGSCGRGVLVANRSLGKKVCNAAAMLVSYGATALVALILISIGERYNVWKPTERFRGDGVAD